MGRQGLSGWWPVQAEEVAARMVKGQGGTDVRLVRVGYRGSAGMGMSGL
jgi:hypothetical protein